MELKTKLMIEEMVAGLIVATILILSILKPFGFIESVDGDTLIAGSILAGTMLLSVAVSRAKS